MNEKSIVDLQIIAVSHCPLMPSLTARSLSCARAKMNNNYNMRKIKQKETKNKKQNKYVATNGEKFRREKLNRKPVRISTWAASGCVLLDMRPAHQFIKNATRNVTSFEVTTHTHMETHPMIITDAKKPFYIVLNIYSYRMNEMHTAHKLIRYMPIANTAYVHRVAASRTQTHNTSSTCEIAVNSSAWLLFRECCAPYSNVCAWNSVRCCHAMMSFAANAFSFRAVCIEYDTRMWPMAHRCASNFNIQCVHLAILSLTLNPNRRRGHFDIIHLSNCSVLALHCGLHSRTRQQMKRTTNEKRIIWPLCDCRFSCALSLKLFLSKDGLMMLYFPLWRYPPNYSRYDAAIVEICDLREWLCADAQSSQRATEEIGFVITRNIRFVSVRVLCFFLPLVLCPDSWQQEIAFFQLTLPRLHSIILLFFVFGKMFSLAAGLYSMRCLIASFLHTIFSLLSSFHRINRDERFFFWNFFPLAQNVHERERCRKQWERTKKKDCLFSFLANFFLPPFFRSNDAIRRHLESAGKKT